MLADVPFGRLPDEAGANPYRYAGYLHTGAVWRVFGPIASTPDSGIPQTTPAFRDPLVRHGVVPADGLADDSFVSSTPRRLAERTIAFRGKHGVFEPRCIWEQRSFSGERNVEPTCTSRGYAVR